MNYENGPLKCILVDGGYIENGQSHFYLQDHLRNNRVVAKSDGTVIQTNHYYPYGMSFAEGTFADKQPYKYNGKELDTENGLNLYDYDARQMETALGCFTSVDPMAEKYYNWSPYTYCLGNPLKYIDPDGKQGIPLPLPLPIYYPIQQNNLPSSREIRTVVNSGISNAVSSFKASIALGVSYTMISVEQTKQAISPEFENQRNREKRDKEKLD